MIIFNYEPQNRDEIVKRRMEKGSSIPEANNPFGEKVRLMVAMLPQVPPS